MVVNTTRSADHQKIFDSQHSHLSSYTVGGDTGDYGVAGRCGEFIVWMFVGRILPGLTGRGRVVGGVLAAALVALLVQAAGVAPAAASGALTGPHAFGWGFSDPDAVSSDGTHVWVASGLYNYVVELNAVTGAEVRLITGVKYGFNDPDAVSGSPREGWRL